MEIISAYLSDDFDNLWGGMLFSLRSSLDNRLTIVNSSSVAASSIKSRFMITFLFVNFFSRGMDENIKEEHHEANLIARSAVRLTIDCKVSRN
ncbi:hypothetical protein [Erwinia aphidicola]|uniref:hypothetical protein n=1 Tax=Erwinia aphidicola TaxID=68334 RepID=UPI001E3A0DCE|nr:hypothetical protein [Erwinia aphidicola]